METSLHHQCCVVKILDSNLGGEALLQHYVDVALPHCSKSLKLSRKHNILCGIHTHHVKSPPSNPRQHAESGAYLRSNKNCHSSSAPILYMNSMLRDRMEQYQLYVCSFHNFRTAQKFITLIGKSIVCGRAFPYLYVFKERMRCVWHMEDNDSISTMIEEECERQKLWFLISSHHSNIIDTLFSELFHLHLSVINCVAVPRTDWSNKNSKCDSYDIDMKMIVQHTEELDIFQTNLAPAVLSVVAKYCQEIRFLGGLAGDANLNENHIGLHVGQLLSHFETYVHKEGPSERMQPLPQKCTSAHVHLERSITSLDSYENDITIENIKVEVDELPIEMKEDEGVLPEHCKEVERGYHDNNSKKAESPLCSKLPNTVVPVVIVPPRQLESNGPCLLVQCPFCWTLYRSSKNRFLLLLRHISSKHKHMKSTALLEIKSRYPYLFKRHQRYVKKFLQ